MLIKNLKNIHLSIKAKNISLKQIGLLNFYLGVLCLSSALPVSGLFLLISLIISLKIKNIPLTKDKFNYPLLVTLLLMSLSCLRNYFFNFNNLGIEGASPLIWLDFLEWILFFIMFWGFQSYLNTVKLRSLFSKILIISLIPVLISCILQKWFNIYGPFATLNNSIVWFQRPIGYWDGRVTGLFNNPNYTGVWLSTSLPFLFQFSRNKKPLKILFSYIIISLIIYFILQSGSRNAVLSFLISLSFLITFKTLVISSLIILILIIFSNYYPLILSLFGWKDLLNFKSILEKVIHSNIFYFSNSLRFELWSNTINLISQKPILGWGSATFAIIYQLQNKITQYEFIPQHAHNILLQLAYSYGIIVAVFLSSTVFFILFFAYNKIFKNNPSAKNSIDKIWFASSFIMVLSNLNDITYFDGKFSVLSWILIAGLKCCIDDKIYQIKKI